MKTEIQTKLELAEILVKHLDCKDTSKALSPLYDYMKEQLSIYRVVERSEQLCQHQWHKHPSHPKIGAMLCRKCGTELA